MNSSEDNRPRTKGGSITTTEEQLKAFAYDLHVVIEFVHVVKKYVPEASDSWRHLEQLERGFLTLQHDVEEDLCIERAAEEATVLTSTRIDASDINSLQSFLDSLYVFAMDQRGVRECPPLNIPASRSTTPHSGRRPM